jgi:hypothetical protein
MREHHFVRQHLWCLLCIPVIVCSCSPLPVVDYWLPPFRRDLALTVLSSSVTEKYSPNKGEISLDVRATNLGNVSIEGASVTIRVSEKTVASPVPVYYELTSTTLTGISISPLGSVAISVKADFSGCCYGCGGRYLQKGDVLGYEANAYFLYQGLAPGQKPPPGQDDADYSNNCKELGYHVICRQLALAQVKRPWRR